MPSDASNQIIPIQQDGEKQAVLGRDLHTFLEVDSNYTTWFQRMQEYGFTVGQDFVSKNGIEHDKLGRQRVVKNHIISLDMAKEISMIQRSEKGKQARQYFLECERQARAPKVDGAELTRMELIQIAMNAETERLQLEAKNKELEPKADAYDSFLDSDGTYSVGNVAKMLGKSQNKLFSELRNSGIFISKGAMRNTPYQKYMHHFAVKAHEFERKDQTTGCSYTTRVQPSGIDFIRKKLGLSSIDPMLPGVQ